MSNNKFYCPHCGGNLNPNKKVITVTKTESGKIGLVLQSEICGDYKYITDPSFVIEPNEKLSHSCPLCQSDLQSKEIPNCSELIVIENHKKGRIFFANNNGEEATYLRWESGDEQSFGKDRQSCFSGYTLHEMNYEDHDVARMR